MKYSRQLFGALRLVPAAVVLLAGLGLSAAALAAPEVMVYKSPYCGCCEKWVAHMEIAGFTVHTQNVGDIGAIKAKFGISGNLASCHTAVVDGKHVVEGHVPADLVKRMMADDDDVVALAVPGMPAGSPGMETPNPVSFQVVAAYADGRTEVYETVEGRSTPH